MGYDIHITRKDDWGDEHGPEISLEEWLGVVRADPEMRLDGYAEAPVDGGTLRIESAGLAVWTAWSRHVEDGNMAWFDISNGNIAVKNPDEEMLGKMWALAQILSAKVQGDDGELYDASGNQVVAPEETPPKKPWWRRLI